MYRCWMLIRQPRHIYSHITSSALALHVVGDVSERISKLSINDANCPSPLTQSGWSRHAELHPRALNGALML